MNKLIIILCAAVIATAIVAWWPQDLPHNDSAAFTSGAYLGTNGSIIDFDDIHHIQISAWLPRARSTTTLELHLENGDWVLPQFSNYPVDHANMLGATIGNILSLKKRHLETTDSTRFPMLQVVAPDSLQVASSTEKGKRITLKNKNGQIILDLIWGLYNTSNEYTYVRNVGSDEVYTTAAHLSFNTDHNAWIQKRLVPYDQTLAQDLYTYAFNGKPFQEKIHFHYDSTSFRWRREQIAIPADVFQQYMEYFTLISFIHMIPKSSVDHTQLLDYGFRLDTDQKIVNGSQTFDLHFNNGAQFSVIFGKTVEHQGIACRLAQFTVADPNQSSSTLKKYQQFYYFIKDSWIIDMKKKARSF